MPESEGYRVPQVCKVVGISYRQLDYWARTGLVTPSIREAGGSGTQRLYSFQDMVQLRVVKKLLDAGLSLQKIRKAVGFLQEHLDDGPAQVTLLSDGSSVYAAQSEDEIFDLLKRGQGVFAIAVDRVWDDLAGSLGRRGRAKARPAAAVPRVGAGGA
jgi:DNA-binding transcriptional MerR regulator